MTVKIILYIIPIIFEYLIIQIIHPLINFY
jgi:hypothetical protein